jgi:hypothetical protein
LATTADKATDDPVVRDRVGATWAFRTRAEIEATARFARMARELKEAGAEAVVWEGAASASEDEARHRDLCAVVARTWGRPEAIEHVAPRERIGRTEMDRRDRLLWEVVSVCCLGETMNTALMTRCLEVAKDAQIRDTLHALLKDEVRHARLGWAHLAAERATGRGAFLRDVLPLLLEASVEPHFFEPSNEPWTDRLYDYGELPAAELLGIFVDTLEQVFFKGLDAMGVDTSQGRAWLAERVPGAEPDGSA